MFTDDQLHSLNENEIKVLYFRCKNLSYVLIGDKLGFGEDWAQLQMSNAYRKLGFKKEMHWTKRRDILKNEVCPRLPKKIEDLKGWKREEVIETTEEFREEIREEAPETKPDPEMLALVLYDEQHFSEEKDDKDEEPPVINIPSYRQLPPPSPNQFIRLIRLVIFIVIGLVLVSMVGYIAYSLGKGSVNPAPAITQVIQAITEVLPTPPPSPTLPPTTPIPTVPTETPTQVPTPTVKPDFYPAGQWVDFSNGIYVRLNDDLYSMPDCRPLGDQFAVELQFHYEGGQYLVRYDSSAFQASDDTGKVYKLLGAGHIFCNEIGVQNIESNNRDIHITLLFDGSFPLEAKYIVITADSINGVKLVFRKDL